MSTFDSTRLTPELFNETLTLVDPPPCIQAFREYNTIQHVFQMIGMAREDWGFVRATRTNTGNDSQAFHFIEWQHHVWSEQRHGWVDSMDIALADLEGELREMVALMDPDASTPAFAWAVEAVPHVPSLRGQPREVVGWVATFIHRFPEGQAALEARMLDATLAGSAPPVVSVPRL